MILVFLASQVFYGCNDKKKPQPTTEKELREQMIEANRAFVKNESAEIDAYIKRRGYEMTATGSGLRYMIYQEGKGDTAKPGMFALIKFKVSLLDGTLCYSSESKGPQEFKISEDNVESGLHEGILKMNEGDKAIMILPPHLAHGVLGDENKIPALSTIVYDVELISLR